MNELERHVGTYLYGRRMYEVMLAWEGLELAGQPPAIQDYAEIWRAADKIVFSRTLESVSSVRTRLEREFDLDLVRRLKEEAAQDLAVAGPDLAGQAIKAGLIDEYHLVLAPAIVGGGKQMLPDDVRLDLELVDEHRFASGFVFLRYTAR